MDWLFDFFQNVLNFDLRLVYAYRSIYLQGAWNTLQITFISVIIGTILGVIIGLARLSSFKILRGITLTFIDVFRGTPLLVQILIIHSALLPTIFGSSQGVWVSGIVALSLNSAAYVAEIFRAGIQSLDKGQMEASRSLGMTYWQATWNIILPQAFKRMLPPLGNETIMLLKDSSLLMVISFKDIMYAGKTVQGATFKAWEAYLPVAVIYLIMTLVLARFVRYLEKRYSTEGVK
ncbi:amino acid ABC transporter permease [Bacillus horti]|uniref:Polar amino acid transport system permease protein n=1 Tax=Caldalkalibacillus horti TaxID=77523 RepID=A0ABT9W403_9BACI|nr:amino acid ABC transporter permease [Bacillus horti]MDQ0167977.1 polar amino acid transport system permease protein [Bacillus horti]